MYWEKIGCITDARRTWRARSAADQALCPNRRATGCDAMLGIGVAYTTNAAAAAATATAIKPVYLETGMAT